MLTIGELVGVHGIAQHEGDVKAWTSAPAKGLEKALGHPVKLPKLDLEFHGAIYLHESGSSAGDVGGQRSVVRTPTEQRSAAVGFASLAAMVAPGHSTGTGSMEGTGWRGGVGHAGRWWAWCGWSRAGC